MLLDFFQNLFNGNPQLVQQAQSNLAGGGLNNQQWFNNMQQLDQNQPLMDKINGAFSTLPFTDISKLQSFNLPGAKPVANAVPTQAAPNASQDALRQQLIMQALNNNQQKPQQQAAPQAAPIAPPMMSNRFQMPSFNPVQNMMQQQNAMPQMMMQPRQPLGM